MIFSFTCPFPCHRQILVEAENYDDGTNKLIKAGALSCRNANFRCHCAKTKLHALPLPAEELKRIVKMSMQEEESKDSNLNLRRETNNGEKAKHRTNDCFQ